MSRLKRQQGRRRSRRRTRHSEEISHLVKKVLKTRRRGAGRSGSYTPEAGLYTASAASSVHDEKIREEIFVPRPGMRDGSATVLIEILSLARHEAAESLNDEHAAQMIGKCIWQIMHRFGYLPSEDDWSRVPTVQ